MIFALQKSPSSTHIWHSDGLKRLTDYIEPSDSLADHISCLSDFLEEGRITSHWTEI